MFLAIDIGGTKTLLGLFTKSGELKEKFRFETPQNYDTFLAVLRRHVEPLLNQDIDAVCVGAPGVIDRARGVGHRFGNLPWKDVTLRKDIELIVGAPVVIENDANLAGLSEARNLKDDFKKVLFVTISTGIGTGIIVNDVIYPPLADSEGGRIMLEFNGKPAQWESFASGKAIERRFGKQGRDIHDVKTWKIICYDIARGLIDLIAVIQPDVIVIGGGIGTHFDRFGDLLKAELNKYDTPMAPIPPIRGAKRAEEAVLYGCFEMLKDNYGKAA